MKPRRSFSPPLAIAFGITTCPTDRGAPTADFHYAISPYEDWHRQAWAGALVLVIMIFLVNVIVRVSLVTGFAQDM